MLFIRDFGWAQQLVQYKIGVFSTVDRQGEVSGLAHRHEYYFMHAPAIR